MRRTLLALLVIVTWIVAFWWHPVGWVGAAASLALLWMLFRDHRQGNANLEGDRNG